RSLRSSASNRVEICELEMCKDDRRQTSVVIRRTQKDFSIQREGLNSEVQAPAVEWRRVGMEKVSCDGGRRRLVNPPVELIERARRGLKRPSLFRRSLQQRVERSLFALDVAS